MPACLALAVALGPGLVLSSWAGDDALGPRPCAGLSACGFRPQGWFRHPGCGFWPWGHCWPLFLWLLAPRLVLASQAVPVPSGPEASADLSGWTINVGRPGSWTVPHSHKLPLHSHKLQWWKQPLHGWKHIPCPMPLLEILSWTLQIKSCGNTAPQKELSQKTGLISKTIS